MNHLVFFIKKFNNQIVIELWVMHSLAKEGSIPCDSGGAYSPPYQGGAGGGCLKSA